MARTWNTYGSPSVRLGTVAVSWSAGTVTAFSQLPYLSLTSTTYPVIGEPPSLFGGVHLRSTWSLSQSVAWRLPGFPGSSEKF